MVTREIENQVPFGFGAPRLQPAVSFLSTSLRQKRCLGGITSNPDIASGFGGSALLKTFASPAPAQFWSASRFGNLSGVSLIKPYVQVTGAPSRNKLQCLLRTRFTPQPNIISAGAGYIKGGISITVPLTFCLTGLDQSVLQIETKIVSCHTADCKPVKREVNGTVILPPLSIPWQVCLGVYFVHASTKQPQIGLKLLAGQTLVRSLLGPNAIKLFTSVIFEFSE